MGFLITGLGHHPDLQDSFTDTPSISKNNTTMYNNGGPCSRLLNQKWALGVVYFMPNLADNCQKQKLDSFPPTPIIGQIIRIGN